MAKIIDVNIVMLPQITNKAIRSSIIDLLICEGLLAESPVMLCDTHP